MDPQLSPANSSPLSPFTEPIEPSNGPPSPSSLPSLQTLLHMQSNGKTQTEGSVGRPPSDSSDLSSFDGSDDEPVSQEARGSLPDEEDDEDDEEDEDEDEENEDGDEAEEDEEEDEEIEADLPTPVKRQLHQQSYKQQQLQPSSPSTSRHRPSRSPIVNRPTASGPSIVSPGSSAYPLTRSPKLESPSRRAGSRTPTSNRHLRQSTTPSNLISKHSLSSPSLASASAPVSQPAPSISLLASHVSATQQDHGTRVFPPAPQSLSSTLSDSDEEPDEEDDDDDGEDRLYKDATPELDQKPVGTVDVDMDGEADGENEDDDEDEEEDEDEDNVRAETSTRSQDMAVSPKASNSLGGLEVRTPQDPVNLGSEDIQVEEGELLENDALSETAGINNIKRDHLFVPPSTGIEPIITVEDELVVSKLNGNQIEASNELEDQDDFVSEPFSETKQQAVTEFVLTNGQADNTLKEDDLLQSIVERTASIDEDDGEDKGVEMLEVIDEQSKSEDQPKVFEVGIKPDVIVTAVDETPTGVPPSHSLLAQQRADALEALLKIEIAFARLRDKFHVERMEQCLKEEEQLLDESHPILAHFQSRLSDLRARELVFMGKRSKTFEVSLEKVQQADIEAIWEWWRNGREELQRDMMADVMRKRRRVDREKRAVEGGRPKRPLPIPPQNTSKRVREDSHPPDLEDLLPDSFFHHRPEERRRIREEREAIGPRPGLLGLDERSRDVDLQLLGIGPSMRFRPFEQAQHPLLVPSNPMAHHHHHHHPLHPPPPPPPQPTAQLASQQYHNVHYAPGPTHHGMSLSGGGSQGIPYPFRQGMPYSAEQQHQQQQPPSHPHSGLQPQHQNQHIHVHHQSALSSSQQQASQQQQHNPHPYMFNGLSNGGSFSQPHLSSHPGASFET